jgi:putative ABC transport system ATP-binding protein
MAFIEIKDVVKSYKRGDQQITPLQSISLSIERGEFLVLMGPSGSGKTTLLNLVAGVDRVTSGQIIVDGAQLHTMSRSKLAGWRAVNVGYIFQLYHLVPVLTAYENIELPLLLQSISRAERHTRVMTALEAVGLADRSDHYPRQLSGGQEQRVAIARAIIANPSIIVADEPTGDLDAASAQATLQLLKRLNKEMGKTFIMVTHDSNAAQVGHRTIHLEKGILVDSGEKTAESSVSGRTFG